jgi:hypothetical protein
MMIASLLDGSYQYLIALLEINTTATGAAAA